MSDADERVWLAFERDEQEAKIQEQLDILILDNSEEDQ